MKKQDVKFVGFHLEDGSFLRREDFATLEGGLKVAARHVMYTLCDKYTLNTNGGIIYLEDNTGSNGVFVCENIHTDCEDPVLIVIGEDGRYGIPLRALEVKDDTTLYADWSLLSNPENKTKDVEDDMTILDFDYTYNE